MFAVTLALFTATYATTALSSVDIQRSGSYAVAVDNDTGVAIRLDCATKYLDTVCKYDANGKLTINLSEGLNVGGGSYAFNPSATFGIGSEGDAVFKVTNTSDRSIELSMVNNGGGTVSLMPAVAGGSTTVGAGLSADFYFTLTTLDTAGTFTPILRVQ